MASLNGVSIRNLKTFNGHEGEPLYQGSIYNNGTKLGFWSQDAHGGCDNFDFNETAIEIPFLAWKSSLRGSRYYEYLEIGSFMAVVAGLVDLEKEYKKMVKKGYPVVCYSIDTTVGMWTLNGFKSRTAAESKKSDIEEQLLKYCSKEDKPFILTQIVTSLDGFNIELGSKDGVKEERKRIEKAREEREKQIAKEEQERKAKEQKRNKNGRFKSVQDGNNPAWIIKDMETGRTTRVPTYAHQNVMDALIELFC